MIPTPSIYLSQRSNQRCRSCPVEFRLKKRNNFGFRDRQQKSYHQAWDCITLNVPISFENHKPISTSQNITATSYEVQGGLRNVCKNSVNLFADEIVKTTCTSLLYWQVSVYVLTTNFWPALQILCAYLYAILSTSAFSGVCGRPKYFLARKHRRSVVANCINQEATKFL